MKILVIDVGGTNVKLLATGKRIHRKFESGPELTAAQMAETAKSLTADWEYDAVSIGIPTPVLYGQPVSEPVNLGPGWVGFRFKKAFGCPVKIINDAAMQALGSYEGGRMLFLGLGTGLGSAMVVEGIVQPMELAHLPYRDLTFEDYVGTRALKSMGKKRWRQSVDDVVARLTAALLPDYVVLGGGNAKKLKDLPKGCRVGRNSNAFRGGFRLWNDS